MGSDEAASARVKKLLWNFSSVKKQLQSQHSPIWSFGCGVIGLIRRFCWVFSVPWGVKPKTTCCEITEELHKHAANTNPDHAEAQDSAPFLFYFFQDWSEGVYRTYSDDHSALKLKNNIWPLISTEITSHTPGASPKTSLITLNAAIRHNHKVTQAAFNWPNIQIMNSFKYEYIIIKY